MGVTSPLDPPCSTSDDMELDSSVIEWVGFRGAVGGGMDARLFNGTGSAK